MSIYEKTFDSNNKNWSPDAERNMLFIQATQKYCNQLLRQEGYLSLNDVYKALGFNVSDDVTDPYWHIGWFYNNEHGDGYIDFGVFPKEPWYSDAIKLDFNVDGTIKTQE